jgi:hypothetical protein
MFGQERLKDLERRQDEVVLRSELHRQVLVLETTVWAQRLAWVDSARETTAKARWWLVPAAALGGVFTVRKWRTLLRWLPVGVSLWRWVRSLRRG